MVTPVPRQPNRRPGSRRSGITPNRMTRMPAPALAFTAGRFAGKTAIVTGAASGIGSATAERLAAEGGQPGLIDLAGQIDDAAGKLRADGAAAFAVQGDVAEEGTWQRAARLTRSACGGVDVLV